MLKVKLGLFTYLLLTYLLLILGNTIIGTVSHSDVVSRKS